MSGAPGVIGGAIGPGELAAVARVEVLRGDKRVDWGTAFLVGPRHALTALHVVADRRDPKTPAHGDGLRLVFFDVEGIEGRPIERRARWTGIGDRGLDWALLELLDAEPDVTRVTPLLLRAAPPRVSTPFQSFGYARTNPRDGFVFSGHVENPDGRCDDARAFQLYSVQAAAPGTNVGGQSGAPVFCGGAVVGIVRAFIDNEGTAVGGTIYACPIDAALSVDEIRRFARTDPCAFVPPLPDDLLRSGARGLPAEPFRYLERYRREHARLFAGRCREIAAIASALEDNRGLVLVYGQSGVGKSSLLEAAIEPRMSRDFDVRVVRRSRERGLGGDLGAALGIDAPDVARFEQAWRAEEARRVVHWSAAAAGGDAPRPLLVVLDQVEEAWTRPRLDEGGGESATRDERDERDEIDGLLAILQAHFRAETAPSSRVILSFRKEWLPEIDAALRRFELPSSDVRIGAIDAEAIEEIVLAIPRDLELAATYRLEVGPDVARAIAERLGRDRSSAIAPTLQVLLTNLYRAARARDRASGSEVYVIDRPLLDQLDGRGLGLDDFIAERIDALPPRVQPDVESGLALDLLALHTTESGTAEHRTSDELAASYGDRAAAARALVRALADNYLLVDTSPEGAPPRSAHALAHDTLAPLVRARLARSNLPGQRARRVLDNRARDWKDGKSGDPLDDRDYGVLKNGLRGMRALDSDEQWLVKATERARRGRRLRVRAGALVLLVLAAIAAFVIWQGRQNQVALEATQRRSRAAQLFAEATRTEREGDVVSALRLATRAAQTAPDTDPSLDDYLARVVHLAAAGPVAVSALGPIDGLRAIVSAQGQLVLADDRGGLRLTRLSDDAAEKGLGMGMIVALDVPPPGVDSSAIDVSPDGRWLAARDRERRTLLIWEIDPLQARPVFSLPLDAECQPRFGPDARLVLCFSSLTPGLGRPRAALIEGRWSAREVGPALAPFRSTVLGRPAARTVFVHPAVSSAPRSTGGHRDQVAPRASRGGAWLDDVHTLAHVAQVDADAADLIVLPDGARALVAGARPRLIDLRAQPPVETPLPMSGGTWFAFHPSGRAVISDKRRRGEPYLGVWLEARPEQVSDLNECKEMTGNWLSVDRALFTCTSDPALGPLLVEDDHVIAGPLGLPLPQPSSPRRREPSAGAGPVATPLRWIEVFTTGEVRAWPMRAAHPIARSLAGPLLSARLSPGGGALGWIDVDGKRGSWSEPGAPAPPDPSLPSADPRYSVRLDVDGLTIAPIDSRPALALASDDPELTLLAFSLLSRASRLEPMAQGQAALAVEFAGASASFRLLSQLRRLALHAFGAERHYRVEPPARDLGYTDFVASGDGKWTAGFVRGRARVFRNAVVDPPGPASPGAPPAPGFTASHFFTQDLFHPCDVLDAAFIEAGGVTRLRTICTDGVLRDWFVTERQTPEARAWIEQLPNLTGQIVDDRGVDVSVPGWTSGANRAAFFARLRADKTSAAAGVIRRHFAIDESSSPAADDRPPTVKAEAKD